ITAPFSGVPATVTPRPRRNSSIPSSRRRRKERSTVFVFTPRTAARSRAGGSRSPGFASPSAIARRISAATCSKSSVGSCRSILTFSIVLLTLSLDDCTTKAALPGRARGPDEGSSAALTAETAPWRGVPPDVHRTLPLRQPACCRLSRRSAPVLFRPRRTINDPRLPPASRPQLERDIPVLAAWPRLCLGQRRLERVDQHGPRPPRLDHVVDVAALGSAVGIRELLLVVGDQLLALFLRAVAVDDVHSAFRPHHGDLRRRPGEVEVGADVLRAHDVVGAAVRLARDHRQLRHRRLAVRIEELRAVADDPAPLLRRPRQEARDVDERDERDVEG